MMLFKFLQFNANIDDVNQNKIVIKLTEVSTNQIKIIIVIIIILTITIPQQQSYYKLPDLQKN